MTNRNMGDMRKCEMAQVNDTVQLVDFDAAEFDEPIEVHVDLSNLAVRIRLTIDEAAKLERACFHAITRCRGDRVRAAHANVVEDMIAAEEDKTR